MKTIRSIKKIITIAFTVLVLDSISRISIQTLLAGERLAEIEPVGGMAGAGPGGSHVQADFVTTGGIVVGIADGGVHPRVTANAGIHVLMGRNEGPGLIPDLYHPVTVAFSGGDKTILYLPQADALAPDGKAWAAPETIRDTPMTIYTPSTLACGLASRTT